MTQESIQVLYTGPFDSNVLTVLAQNLEYSLTVDPKVTKKLFKIFIELAQNIALYSAERVLNEIENAYTGFGSIILKEFDDFFVFSSGNIAIKSDIDPVLKKCDTINSLTREELRDYKRQQRKMPPSKKGGGNIGLIQVALMAGNPLTYKIINIDDNQFFYIISVKISKLATDDE
jgi:hypothetical protein